MHEDFGFILAATLTLLGLIIGFSFSMATCRYDQRKNYEEAEANAIGTEYVRADSLPAADAASVRDLLRKYLHERVLFYETHDEHELQQINARTAPLQTKLWTAIRAPVAAQPNPVMALVVSGMNDVLNSQGYTQAGYWNRIPTAAWDRGLDTMRAIFGAGIESALKSLAATSPDLARCLVEFPFGDIYPLSRPGSEDEGDAHGRSPYRSRLSAG